MSLLGLFKKPEVAKLKANQDIKGLIKALSYKKDTNIRRAAAQTLGEIGDPQSVESLIPALEDKDDCVRQASAVAMGQIGNEQAVKPLISLLRGGEGVIRQVAAEALGKIGDNRAVEPLIALLRDQDVNMRESAARSLDTLGWKPDKNEDGVSYWIVKQEWQKCIESGTFAIKPLAAALKYKDKKINYSAAETLVKIGPPAVESLIDALHSQDNNVQKIASESLIKIGTPVVESLTLILKNRNKRVCQAASFVLKEIQARDLQDIISQSESLSIDSVTGIKTITAPKDCTGYLIEQTIDVKSNGTLILGDGLQLFFAPGTGIRVNGTLQVNGNKTRPVMLRPSNIHKGWSGISFSNNSGGKEGHRLKHCHISRAFGFGKDDEETALYCGKTRVNLENCYFEFNKTALYGGQGSLIYLSGCEVMRSESDGMSFKDCESIEIVDTIVGEQISGHGIYVGECPIKIAKSRIVQNNAKMAGGVCVSRSPSLVITDTLFEENKASDKCGALIILESPGAKILNCKFYGNIAVKDHGGAIVILGSSHMVIKNNEFKGNVARTNAGAILQINSEPTSWNFSGNRYSGNRPSDVEGFSNELGGFYEMDAK